jgi:hypothetical protein
MRRIKGRSSRKIQQEFPEIRKRYWGRHFWARGFFSTTAGAICDDMILQYLAEHLPEPTGVRWGGCRPPQTASRCASIVVLKATKQKGRRDE